MVEDCSKYNKQRQYGTFIGYWFLKKSYNRHFNDNWENLSLNWILGDITELYF